MPTGFRLSIGVYVSAIVTGGTRTYTNVAHLRRFEGYEVLMAATARHTCRRRTGQMACGLVNCGGCGAPAVTSLTCCIRCHRTMIEIDEPRRRCQVAVVALHSVRWNVRRYLHAPCILQDITT